MMTQVKLIAATLVLSIVVWIYADQSSQSRVSAEVWVRLTARPGWLPIVRLPAQQATQDASVVRVRAELAGPKAATRRLAGEEQVGRIELTVPVPDTWGTGEHPIDLVEALNKSQKLLDRGLHVESVAPESVTVLLDEWATETFRVVVDAGPFKKSLEQDVIVIPSRVQGRFRKSLRSRFGDAEPIVAVNVQSWLAGAAGQVGPIKVALPDTVSGVPVTFEPREVAFTAVLTKTEPIKLARIVVDVKVPPDMLGHYTVTFADEGDRLQDASVLLPADQADILRPEDVTAYVQIRPEDAQAAPGTGTADGEGWVMREVHFVFPEGFDAVLAGDAPQIKLKVMRVPTPEPRIGAESVPPIPGT